MILWFGKKKKKQELLEAGAAMEEAEQVIPPADAAASRSEDTLSSPVSSDHSLPEIGPSPDPVAPLREPAQAAADPTTHPDAETPELAEDDPVSETRTPGFFGRLSDGLSKSSSRMGDRLTGLFTRRKLDDEALEDLEDLLLTSDMGGKVAQRVTEALSRERYDKDVSQDELKKALADEIEAIMAPREQIVDFSAGPRPRIVLFVGVNGSGKTTTIGKIASKLKAQGARALLVAGDTFRAAAIEQLNVWGDRAGIPVMSKPTGADAAGLVFEAVERARSEDLDLVLVDTAGRLQNKTELMSELAKIVRVTRKLDPEAPHDVILVLDATVGQNAMSQVEAFRHTADVSGIVMTKLDGTAKGGVLVAVAEAHALPIHFIGVGEGADDLQPFSARAYARALVGLTEKVEPD
ncbi:MAG: signal recognition particle-docking protein FtsY [Henriciella sp.]